MTIYNRQGGRVDGCQSAGCYYSVAHRYREAGGLEPETVPAHDDQRRRRQEAQRQQGWRQALQTRLKGAWTKTPALSVLGRPHPADILQPSDNRAPCRRAGFGAPKVLQGSAVHGTYDTARATVEANTLWGGSCILFDNGPRLLVADNPAIENADRITIEAWVNTLG